MKLICALLYIVGGALPLVGLIALGIRTRRARNAAKPRVLSDEIAKFRKEGFMSTDVIEAMARAVESQPFLAWAQVRRDLALIGIGIVLTTIASVMSLLPA